MNPQPPNILISEHYFFGSLNNLNSLKPHVSKTLNKILPSSAPYLELMALRFIIMVMRGKLFCLLVQYSNSRFPNHRKWLFQFECNIVSYIPLIKLNQITFLKFITTIETYFNRISKSIIPSASYMNKYISTPSLKLVVRLQ